MDTIVEEFINSKRIAVVGVSHDEKKFGNAIYKELKSRGFEVYAVNPSMREFAGEPCYPDLIALQGKADAVVICVHPSKSADVVGQAAQAGIRKVWLQQGAESDAAFKAGKDAGLDVVSQKCILMYAPPVKSFHGFHRFLVKLTGKL